MRILSIGEILWDVLPGSEHLGGAPLNFAYHARRLGHEVGILSALGDDQRGRKALRFVGDMGLEARFIQQADAPTGAVHVRFSDGQPSYRFESPAAYEQTRAGSDVLAGIADWRPDWVYFGSLFSSRAEALATTKAVLGACRRAKRFYDANLRPGAYSTEAVRALSEQADILKLSEEEMPAFAEIVGVKPMDRQPFLRALQQRLDCEVVCLSRGEQGCALLWGDRYVECPAFRVSVADAVGAGDAFSAAILHGWTLGLTPDQAAAFANRVGALVASRPGATPEWVISDLDGMQRKWQLPVVKARHS